jgi:phosphatidylglycerophosphate synthase
MFLFNIYYILLLLMLLLLICCLDFLASYVRMLIGYAAKQNLETKHAKKIKIFAKIVYFTDTVNHHGCRY